MTDNEIIKALELHSDPLKTCVSECAYGDQRYCGSKMAKDVLDLIKRYKAENERFKREIEDLESTQEITPEAKYLVDTKADKVISLMNEIIKSQDQIKAEAIKEFAERLKSRLIIYTHINLNHAIDNIVKEMTEETLVSSDEICVACGEQVPEGRQVCHKCETGQEFLNKRKE